MTVYDLKPRFQRLLEPLADGWVRRGVRPNAVDGLMATRHGLATPLGKMLNEIADVASDAALDLPFVCVTGSWLVAPVVVLAAPTEVAGILGTSVGA